MNFLLSLNKKIFLIFSIILFCISILTLLFFINSSEELNNVDISFNNTSDITKPKFSINSNKQKILITANEGNFITENEIMLENNVIFKSKKFEILGDKVIFDKKNLIASSSDKSKFISKNASIDSIGFDIIENGNIINFKGNTKLTLR